VSDNGTCGDGRLGRPADAKQGGTITTAENLPRRSEHESLAEPNCEQHFFERAARTGLPADVVYN